MSSELPSNPRGIPKAPFVDVVEKFIVGSDAETLLKKFNETLFTYRRMETSMQTRKKNLDFKVPELEKTLRAAEMLSKKRKTGISKENPLKVQFGLADSVFADAVVENAEKVGIWLGANVMLEYELDEAVSVLSSKLKQARESLDIVKEDLLFLKEQITTMEVNIARVYNWDVKRRKASASSSLDKDEKSPAVISASG